MQEELKIISLNGSYRHTMYVTTFGKFGKLIGNFEGTCIND